MTSPPLDDGLLKALTNLHMKQLGQDVAFINIADAQLLTELGLAIRTAQGWRITKEGDLVLKRSASAMTRSRPT